MPEVNPATMEMIKSRLVAIGQEMAATMVRTAGTPIYAEIKDFSCGLFDYRARQVVYSGLAVTHNVAIHNLVHTSIQRYEGKAGIFDGDLFMGNDPYYGGGIHTPELGLASPIFVDGEIVAWSGSIAHQLDIGGMTPGGFCLDATECFQEGIRFPPVRLFRRGELQQDIWDIHRNNVRLPDKIGMELKGQIAANNVARKRVKELAQRFGVQTFKDACDALIQLSARVTQERIRQLPEGLYEDLDMIEAEGVGKGLYNVYCDLTIKDGELLFDFTRECPPQLPASINCTNLVVRGMVFAHVMPLLCFDIPWNEGCTYPIKVITTPGSVLDAQPPAACSNPSVSFRAADAALSALNKALINSPLRKRLTATWDGSPPIILGMAAGAPGHPPIMIPMLEGMSGGGGAFSFKDGLDAGSMLSIMEYSMGDVEIQENAYPILFLTRRFLKDSGGPGRYRGGVGSMVAIVPHNAQALRFYLLEDRRLVPSHGTAGGYPGAAHHFFERRGADVHQAAREGLGNTKEALAQMTLLPQRTVLDLGPHDVFAFTSNAGGGFGDPINRDPQRVARDIQWGFVSAEKAKEIYGVILKPGELTVNEIKTGEERESIRRRRSEEAAIRQCDPAGGDYIRLDNADERASPVCSGCGQRLSTAEDNWKENVPRRDLRMDATGVFIPGDDRVVLRQYSCPACGLLLDSEVTLTGLKPLRDYRKIAASR